MSHEIPITDLSLRIVMAAQAASRKIITAESCTAGALATILADTPGAGEVLLGGFVTYARTCKAEILGLDPASIAQHSAVSKEVTVAMAKGALAHCPTADIAVAITCAGGPRPDADGNPVGLTHIVVTERSGGTLHEVHHLGGETSGRVRGEVLYAALRMLDKAVQKTQTFGG